MENYEKIAKILRTDRDVIRIIEEKMSEITGRNTALETILEENNSRIESSLNKLGVSSRRAPDIFSALISKIKEDDQKLRFLIHKEAAADHAGFKNLLNFAKEASGISAGKFLKLEKAEGLIHLNPPPQIMKFLGYKNSRELLDKEDIFEIFSAIRFMENPKWLNEVFFRPYELLTLDSFEEREIKVMVLNEKWLKGAEKFMAKKRHNLSHLKELGLIFIVPMIIETAGETMRTFNLALHYFHEIDFYSNLFKKYASEDAEIFAKRFVSSLRGDVLDERFPEKDFGKKWLIIQRYLAKDDEYDWRLFYPHVNPEAIHWAKAEKDLGFFSERFNLGLEFWRELGFVGDFFKDEAGVEVLVSFNLVDTTMSLVQEKDLKKFLYHHPEAIWNKLFSVFLSEEKLEQLIINNFDKGYVSL